MPRRTRFQLVEGVEGVLQGAIAIDERHRGGQRRPLHDVTAFSPSLARARARSRERKSLKNEIARAYRWLAGDYVDIKYHETHSAMLLHQRDDGERRSFSLVHSQRPIKFSVRKGPYCLFARPRSVCTYTTRPGALHYHIISSSLARITAARWNRARIPTTTRGALRTVSPSDSPSPFP